MLAGIVTSNVFETSQVLAEEHCASKVLAAENALQGQLQSRRLCQLMMFLAVQGIHRRPRIFDACPAKVALACKILHKVKLRFMCYLGTGLPIAQHQGCERVNQAPALHFWKECEQHWTPV